MYALSCVNSESYVALVYLCAVDVVGFITLVSDLRYTISKYMHYSSSLFPFWCENVIDRLYLHKLLAAIESFGANERSVYPPYATVLHHLLD